LDDSSASFDALTLRIIPTAKHVNQMEVPPILTMGKDWPVTGTKFTVTAIFTIAWNTRLNAIPTARRDPKRFGHFMAILMDRNRRSRYKNRMMTPPISPYSSRTIA
jgi:hypothetical protein